MRSVRMVVQGSMLLFSIAIFSQSAFAQTSFKQGDPAYMDPKSPETAAANAIGITLYSFDEWDDNHVKQVVTQKAKQLDPGSTDAITKYKHYYYGKIVSDMTFDVGAEYSLISSLLQTKEKFASYPEITTTVMRNVYNDLVNSL